MDHSVISHYRLLHQLGEGGMGVVFAAEDLRLGREVAIKFLRADEPDQDVWLARFEREARLASALQHPHICTIHELGEHNGRPFIVMERLEGRTVKQLLTEGPLPIARAVDFAIQIAEALAAAHERGIVHRDIKPANLFICHGDRLKILDFGLAKVASGPAGPEAAARRGTLRRSGPDVTATGATVGTAAYMSPEQATGSAIDAQTDLFSFGSVLYEMVTAKRAFPGENAAAVLQRLVAGEVIPVRAFSPDVPEGLARIIHRALQTDKTRRYRTAGEILAELRALARDLAMPVGAAPDEPSAGRPPVRRIAAVLATLAVAAAAGWGWFSLAARPRLTDRDSILIGAIANTTGEAVFDQTLLTALKVQLGQSPFLDLVSDARVAEELRLMDRRRDEELDSATARELCQRLGVKAMLEGTLGRLGSNYVLTLNATDCVTGEAVASQQGQAASREEVLRVLGTMASALRTRLGESLPSIERFDVPIEQATTPSLPALKAYSVGLAERRAGRELESIAFFNQALAHDPDFAAAYTTLSTVYGSLGEWRQSEDHARRAYERRGKVSERERLLIEYQYHDRVTGDQEQAADTLRRWKVAYPRDSRPVNALALIHNRLGRYDEAAAEAREALGRSPRHPFPMSNLAFALRGLGRYDEAREVAEEAVSLGVATTPTRRLLYQIGVMQADGSHLTQVEWAKGQPREFDLISAQAQVAAFEGRVRAAAESYREAAGKARARGLEGTASSFAAHLAWTEALYFDRETSRRRVREVVGEMTDSSRGLNALPRYRAVAALAYAGLTDSALKIVRAAEEQYPDATAVRRVLAPTVRAAAALAHDRAVEAVIALEPALPSERGLLAGLVPPFLRAEAFLAQGDPEAARREFRKVLDWRGTDPFAPVIPLAYLGLARAWAAEGDAARSRDAYDELFRMWAHADPDLPVLIRARAEYAALGTPPAR